MRCVVVTHMVAPVFVASCAATVDWANAEGALPKSPEHNSTSTIAAAKEPLWPFPARLRLRSKGKLLSAVKAIVTRMGMLHSGIDNGISGRLWLDRDIGDDRGRQGRPESVRRSENPRGRGNSSTLASSRRRPGLISTTAR